ncbi:MAG: aldo/keto reductase, partial [Muribaculaceae bacterium]|nr:aldo/keto reductase [Muribaculaceae bacterium]
MNDYKHTENNKASGKTLNRRTFLKALGLGTATATAPVIVSCVTGDDVKKNAQEPPVGKMTYRENPKTHEKVSILGYGMMRLPATNGQPFGRDNDSQIDQEMINKQIDYAIEHGVNYFDTSPAYCRGLSERATGIALSRHKREEYFIATKLSNFAPDTWSRVASIEMFRNSLKQLQVEYIDYLLLHSVGGSSEEMTSMEMFEARYIKNG